MANLALFTVILTTDRDGQIRFKVTDVQIPSQPSKSGFSVWGPFAGVRRIRKAIAAWLRDWPEAAANECDHTPMRCAPGELCGACVIRKALRLPQLPGKEWKGDPDDSHG